MDQPEIRLDQKVWYRHKALVRQDRMGLINYKIQHKVPLSDSDREYLKDMFASRRPLF